MKSRVTRISGYCVESNKIKIKFCTAQDPLLNSTRICKVQDHWQEHRSIYLVRTDHNLIIPVEKRVMSVKAAESNEPSGVMYVNASVLKSHAGRMRDWSILWSILWSSILVKRQMYVTSQPRLGCDYNVIAHIVNKFFDPNSSKEVSRQVSPRWPLSFNISSLNLYICWVVCKILELIYNVTEKCRITGITEITLGLTKKLQYKQF